MSLPRKFLTARRKRPSQTEAQSTMPGVEEDRAGIISNNISSNELFGGSGSKFRSLRNRRGVREGGDGRVQTKLFLSVSNDGNGRFSLFTGVGAGRARKRPAVDYEENPSEKKVKVNST